MLFQQICFIGIDKKIQIQYHLGRAVFRRKSRYVTEANRKTKQIHHCTVNTDNLDFFLISKCHIFSIFTPSYRIKNTFNCNLF